MKPESEKEVSLNILKHIEDISNDLNKLMSSRYKAAFRRYPITFGLLILLGVIILNEGLKGVLRQTGLLDIDPVYLLVVGLGILTITGTLYKKLDK